MNPYSESLGYSSDGSLCVNGIRLIKGLERGMGKVTLQSMADSGLIASCSMCHKPLPKYNPDIKNLLCQACERLKTERENIVVIETEKSKSMPMEKPQNETEKRIKPLIVL